jgi:hypothetical protein
VLREVIVKYLSIPNKIVKLAYPHMLRHACGFKLANDVHDTRALRAFDNRRRSRHHDRRSHRHGRNLRRRSHRNRRALIVAVMNFLCRRHGTSPS